jgi:hypothetical protein
LFSFIPIILEHLLSCIGVAKLSALCIWSYVPNPPQVIGQEPSLGSLPGHFPESCDPSIRTFDKQRQKLSSIVHAHCIIRNLPPPLSSRSHCLCFDLCIYQGTDFPKLAAQGTKSARRQPFHRRAYRK